MNKLDAVRDDARAVQKKAADKLEVANGLGATLERRCARETAAVEIMNAAKPVNKA